MKLSVIIVSYNVRSFLEQCLDSVTASSKNISTEVFVVDNKSSDDSVKMVKEKFPQVHLIENKTNKGFSVANNQVIKIAKGEYILLLNPDTIVEPDTFEKTISFMDTHPDAGALGVRMINGEGMFLPESKRGLPTAAVSFYQMIGLAKLFPKSKTFGKYHLKYLDENKINEVEILAGAFMLIRKSVLDKVGLLDEAFFMYGEDIDLSYRLILAGYKNYYFPETTIIHYKGQSSKNEKTSSIKHFYNAMIIFYKKHFMRNKISVSALFIISSIHFISTLSQVKGFFKR